MASFDKGYALIVGVANYDQFSVLPEAVLNDARDISALLTNAHQGGYPPYQLQHLLDNQATAENICNGLHWLAEQTDQDDTAIIFFSGHGGHIENGPQAGNYLIPVDAIPNDLKSTAIEGEELTGLLQNIKAGRLLVLFDCCHAGGTGEIKEVLGKSMPDFKTGLDEQYYDQLAAGQGRAIIASSRSTEVSWIVSEMRNSLFTHYLLEALRGQARSYGDGLIRVFDVFNFVAEEVSRRQPQQHPILKAQLETNFPIALHLGGQRPHQTTRAGPTIENPKHLSLPPDTVPILRTMFEDCQRVVILAEFGAGFSGSRIFMVRPIVSEKTARLRTVVKLGSISLIEKEWQAYQNCIHDRLPDAAQIGGKPLFPPDSEWAGIQYSLQGGGGTFEIQSLYSYLRRADIADIRFVLKRLFRRLEQILQQSSSGFEFHLQATYDRVLPLNYLIEPMAEVGKATKLLSPETVFDQPLKSGDLVRVEGFVITKVDSEHKSVTLNLPGGNSPASYKVRLKPARSIGADRLGRVMDPIEGMVIETRQDKLEAEAIRALGSAFDPTSEVLARPDGPNLPNPLTMWPEFLGEVRDIKVACIHGDLNMENVLVDPETRDVSLIDFAEACQDYVLHDFLRLETEVIIKIIPEIFDEHNLSPETIYTFYQQLHAAVFYANQLAPPPHPALERPWVILLAIREMARQYLWKYNDWKEYYQGLILYLLGALKFENVDTMGGTPSLLPKQVAFWGAATVTELMKGDIPSPPKPIEEQRRIDAVVPSQAEVGQQMDLLVQVRFLDSPLLGIQDWPVKQKPASTEQVTEHVTLNYAINPQTRKPDPARLRIRVIAPNCAIEGEASQFIEIFPEEYSKIVSFLLTPLKTGHNRINVEVYNTDGIHLGVIPVETMVGGASTVPGVIVANLLLVVKVLRYATSDTNTIRRIKTQSPMLESSLTTRASLAKVKASSRAWLGDLSRNMNNIFGLKHIEWVLTYLDKLLALAEEKNLRLTLLEEFILQAAIHLHPLSLSLTDLSASSFLVKTYPNRDLANLAEIVRQTLLLRHYFELTEEIMANQIRMPNGLAALGLERDSHAQAIASLIKSAAKPLSEVSETITLEEQPIRLRLLSAFFRLAEALDIYARGFEPTDLTTTQLPPELKALQALRQYVEEIIISKHEIRLSHYIPTDLHIASRVLITYRETFPIFNQYGWQLPPLNLQGETDT